MSSNSAKGPAKKGKKQTEEDDTVTCDGCESDFLFEDVGLTPAKVPKGKWFCPDCENDNAVICDSCHREFLFEDVGFTRETVPEEDWFCSRKCESKGKTPAKNKKKTKPVSTEIGGGSVIEDIARTLLDPTKDMEHIRKHIQDTYGKKYRKKFTNNMSPDSECHAAAQIALSKRQYDAPAINYTNEATRETLKIKNMRGDRNIIAKSDKELKANHSTKILKGPFTPPILTFAYARELDSTSKDIIKNHFQAAGKGYCGDCWLCGLPVYFYFNDDIMNSLHTGCGECEHIGAIIASLLSGMLTTSGQEDHYIFNYGTSHVHCNQKKSNIISMIFNKRKTLWEIDETGIENIIDKITSGNIHESEYDPLFKNEFTKSLRNKTSSSKFITDMRNRIREQTEIWCRHANEIITNAGTIRTDIAIKITTIIKYTFDTVNERLLGGGPTPEDMESFEPDELNGFEIDDNLNDEIVNKMLSELRQEPIFYELLHNLIASIEKKRIKTDNFTPEMIDEFTYHPTYKTPRNDFYEKEHKQTYFPMDNRMDFPRDNVFGSNQNMISVYGGKRKNKSVKKNKKTRHSKKQNKTRTKTK